MAEREDISARLRRLSEELRAADPTSTDALARLGAALEAASPALAPTGPAARSLADVLQVLQEVYVGRASDPAAALGGAADTLSAAAARLVPAAPAPSAEPAERVAPAAPSSAAEAPGGREEPLTLDDAAARLLGLGAGDTAELTRVREALAGTLAGAGTPPDVAAPLAEARQTLDAVLGGTAADPAAALADAAGALDRALRARDVRAVASLPEYGAVPAAPSPASASAGSAGDRSPGGAAAAPVATPETLRAETAQPPGPEAGAAPDKPVLAADTDLGLLKEYIAESLDQITGAEAALLDLEADPDHAEALSVVFRAFHTIKGTSGFLNLEGIQRLAHLAENMLDRARDGRLRLTGGYADLALASCDALKAMVEGLRTVEPGGPLPVPATYADLMGRLKDPEAAGVSEEASDGGAVPRVGDILVAQGKAERLAVERAAGEQGGDPIGRTLVKKGVASTADVAQALRVQKQMGGPSAGTDAAVRVSTHRLDSLINMVGELVIAHSMIAQDPLVTGQGEGARPRLARNVGQTGKIVRELQDLTMALRMVPLKATFQKMARLVRDLARKVGKSVRFATEGEETEIDRNMVESLGDPLVHMIRNAIDHGVETPDARRAAGKGETGTVRLRAYHSAGCVVIELSDDGKGLDRGRIIAKAVERGLLEPGASPPDSEVFALIFRAGFSTAEQVTDVSGRGVGMDVVRKRLEELQGRVDVASRPGHGSSFTLRLPLTMAITDAMLLRVGAERYLLPTVSILQSFRPEPRAVSTVLGRGEMVMLRGDLIPVVRLHGLFGVGAAVKDPADGILVVIEANGRRCAVLADELLGQQQVVIKTLGSALGQVRGVSGGAILGDGRVGLILDAGGLMDLAHDGGGAAAETLAAQAAGA